MTDPDPGFAASAVVDSATTAGDRLALLRRRLDGRAPILARRRPETREAGVAVILRHGGDGAGIGGEAASGDGLELLLIERVERDGDPWSGHMALPGGMREPRDADLRATAFRETAEEVGLDLARQGELLGRLDELAPSSPRLPPLVIAPWVATVPAGLPLSPEPAEVSTALWVPVDALLDPRARVETRFLWDGREVAFPALGYRGYEIWGLTYRILGQLFALAGFRPDGDR